MKVISCKRNADVKLHLNLQVNLNLVTDVTYAHTDVTSRQNSICPTPAFGRWGHKNCYAMNYAILALRAGFKVFVTNVFISN